MLPAIIEEEEVVAFSETGCPAATPEALGARVQSAFQQDATTVLGITSNTFVFFLMLASFRAFARAKRYSTVSFALSLLHRCRHLDSLLSVRSVHARLVKSGLHCRALPGNGLLNLYSHRGAVECAVQAFREITDKNTYTWNILLAAFLRAGRMQAAQQLFEEMPEKDAVSWNSMISGYVSNGFWDKAFEVFYRMQVLGVGVTAFTLSIAASCVSDARLAKEVHGLMMHEGLCSSNTVVGNSLIAMYGRVGLTWHACRVFHSMESPDVISWNSLISVYGDSERIDEAFNCFRRMQACGVLLDEFTMSALLNVCADLEDLAKGEQLLAHCMKMGFLSNSIVSSAAVDMYSLCDRLDDAIQLFVETPAWDSALYNSMASCYARNGLVHEALKLFVLILRKGIRPTEFTFASILRSNSCFELAVQGLEIHCCICKLGFEADVIIINALVDMYCKLGSHDTALKLFSLMTGSKDVVFWNTMIIGLSQNGKGIEALRFFREMQKCGTKPDRITLSGVLLACCNQGLLKEGMKIFSSMERKYGVVRDFEHYAGVVNMVAKAGRLREANDIIETFPQKPAVALWKLLLEASILHGNLNFAEIVAEKMMELEPHFSLPYVVLAHIYGTKGKWESMARIWKLMEERHVGKVMGYSWICIRGCIFSFSPGQILHCGGNAIYAMMCFLSSEMEIEGYLPDQPAVFEDIG